MVRKKNLETEETRAELKEVIADRDAEIETLEARNEELSNRLNEIMNIAAPDDSDDEEEEEDEGDDEGDE